MSVPPGPAARRAVIRDSLGVGIATGAYGVSFGALGVTSGLDVAQTCALSLLLFSGGSQFALAGVIGAGGTAAAGVGTAVLLGARNGFYGLRLAPLLGVRGGRRALAAQLVIDESTAMALAQRTPELGRQAFWTTGGAVFVLWNLMTAVGALGATALGDPRRFGLDAAGPAAFVALLAPRLRGRDPWLVAALAAVLALALVPVAPAGVPVLAVTAIAVVVGMRSRA